MENAMHFYFYANFFFHFCSLRDGIKNKSRNLLAPPQDKLTAMLLCKICVFFSRLSSYCFYCCSFTVAVYRFMVVLHTECVTKAANYYGLERQGVDITYYRDMNLKWLNNYLNNAVSKTIFNSRQKKNGEFLISLR